MGTDLARRALARPDALTLAPRVARSLARFLFATAFDQDLSGWVVDNVVGGVTCENFCYSAGFSNAALIPSFPVTCGDPNC